MSRFFTNWRIIPATAAALSLLQCGTLTDPSIAGGSGAGNPGGTIALAMVARADLAVAKISSAGNSDISIIETDKPIQITDRSGLKFTMNKVTIRSVDVRFVLDNADTPSALLASMKDRPSYLSCDTNSILLPGPYLFSNIGETAGSSIEPLRLPVARYTGVKLLFSRDYSTAPFPDSLRSQITMNGTFLYQGTYHKIAVAITRSMGPYYRFAGGIFTLSPKDTTHLELQFNARRWFANVDFTYGLSRGQIAFDTTGSLNISSGCSDHEPSRQIEEIIAEDFALSGRLVVY